MRSMKRISKLIYSYFIKLNFVIARTHYISLIKKIYYCKKLIFILLIWNVIVLSFQEKYNYDMENMFNIVEWHPKHLAFFCLINAFILLNLTGLNGKKEKFQTKDTIDILSANRFIHPASNSLYICKYDRNVLLCLMINNNLCKKIMNRNDVLKLT